MSNVNQSNTQKKVPCQLGIWTKISWKYRNIENKLVINVAKSKCMMLGSNHLLKDSPGLNLSVGGLSIEQVAEAKLLGVIVDSRLTWNAQIKLILNKMGRSMAVVRHCRKCIPIRIRKTLVESVVLCHLDYCSIISFRPQLQRII